jgi:hypothetical protein
MPLNIHERHLVDRFLNGELSGIELEEFNEKVSADADFAREVDLQKVIYSGIAHAREEELKLKIKIAINYRKARVPFALKLIIVFLVILVLGISFWSYVGNEFEKLKPYNNFVSLFKGEAKQENAEKKKKNNPIIIENDHKVIEPSADSVIHDTTAAIPDTTLSSNAVPEEDIEVKKDIMIVARSIPVIDKSTQKDESLSKDVSKKLPDADLPTEERVDTFIVEFWVSPIHYRGYKMSKNKVVLFGIENLEDVKLYRVNNSIYMSYDNDWFPLMISYDFTPYQKLKESDLPQELK